MVLLKSLVLPLLRYLDPEVAHKIALEALAWGVSVPLSRPKDRAALETHVLGLRFSNPIGIAAGFDKNARVVRSLAQMGFGFVEAGTVTLRPQEGNPKPRLFRLEEDRAVINRMGFNNQGVDRFADRLACLLHSKPPWKKREASVPVGANIGINKKGANPEQDYPALVTRLKPYVDYIVINVSSPNTPGLRDLQNATRLRKILDSIAARHDKHPPLLVKLAPDLDDETLPDIVEATVEGGVQGLIVCNTTLARPVNLRSSQKKEVGGLSGRPLTPQALALLRRIAQISAGRLVLVSCGGIESGLDILERIRLGAHLVQVYTAFAYEGPALLPRLKREMLSIMLRQGVQNLNDIRGSAL